MENKLCSNCGDTLICGANQTTESCWCFTYPSIMPIDSQQDCLCENCLSASVQEKRREDKITLLIQPVKMM